MKDWKIKQEIFYRLNGDDPFSDDLSDKPVEMVDEIPATAIRYFYERDIGWLYPAKSYAVGVLYAKWISEEFGEDFYEVLDDPELLYGNDPYFVPYSSDRENYDKIIAAVPQEKLGMIPDIRQYFEQEFML